MSVPSTAPHRPALRLVGGAEASELQPPLDPRDFDAVFRRFSPYVARVALRLLGSDSEVDDLVQEVFLEAHRGLDQLRDAKALRGWLSRVCVRRATRRLRRRRLRSFFSLELVEERDLPVSLAATPEQRLEVARVYRCLDRLPTEQRVAWVLRYVEGESLEDLVVLCGCSKSTVQRRLRAAQARIEQEVPT
ncbi:MAG TPA: sigma-70 family RNA polymerase sigma factor [Polyangiaceae bacterium]